MLQFGLSASPTSHGPWLHVATPQTLFTQLIEQQSDGPLHATPSREHFGWQTPASHDPLQHSASALHLPPFG